MFPESHPCLFISNNRMTVTSKGIGKHRGTILIGEIMTNGFYVIELTLDRPNNTSGLCIIDDTDDIIGPYKIEFLSNALEIFVCRMYFLANWMILNRFFIFALKFVRWFLTFF